MRSLLVVLLFLSACRKDPAPAAGEPNAPTTSEQPHAKLPVLTVDEVEQRLAANDGKFFVFDDNQRKMFDEGHVPGAVWLLANEVTADKLPKDKDATLVFYCANQH